jgi:hypothetical protein
VVSSAAVYRPTSPSAQRAETFHTNVYRLGKTRCKEICPLQKDLPVELSVIEHGHQKEKIMSKLERLPGSREEDAWLSDDQLKRCDPAEAESFQAPVPTRMVSNCE